MNDFSDTTLSLTCPICQHAWEMDTPAIPWRALPAFKREACPACHATLRVLLQAKDGQLHMSINKEK